MHCRYQQSQQRLLHFVPEPSGKGVITRVECMWQTANNSRTLFTDKSSVRCNGRQNAVLPHGAISKVEAMSTTQKQEVCGAT